MLVLDENLPASQRKLLRQWRIRFRSVGEELGTSGILDENLLPLLHHLAQPTFVSLDRDFYQPELAHHRYCLVWLNVRGREAAEFIRRFLKHPTFNTRIKRLGWVTRVHVEGISAWRVGHHDLQEIPWHD